jgi:Pyruvate/2-oxoacid:ferredoxin oxidoreductase delta subunit
MVRKLIQIDEEKCNGCCLCVSACHEGAIEIIDGKAKLVSDEYCDGLGDCLPECPQDAISIIERKAAPFDEESVKERKKALAAEKKNENKMACGCPGSLERLLEKGEEKQCVCDLGEKQETQAQSCCSSELKQWPVQLALLNPKASYLKGSNLLIAADCTAYAYGSFHQDFIKDRITLIGCPKLDDNDYYTEKLVEILIQSTPKSITVVRMEVPCCGGLVRAVKEAMLRTETILPYSEIVISTDGRIISN